MGSESGEQRFTIYWAAVGGVIATAVYGELTTRLLPDVFPRFFDHIGIVQALIAGALSCIVIPIWNAVPAATIQAKPVRRALFPQSSLEGYWLQDVKIPERPWSISELKKNAHAGWRYHGTAYAKNGARKARWESSDLAMDREKAYWVFCGRSFHYEDGNPVKGGNVMSVLYWKGYADGEGVANRTLLGYLLDLGFENVLDSARLSMVRIEDSDWRTAGISKPHTMLTIEQFLRLQNVVTNRPRPADAHN